MTVKEMKQQAKIKGVKNWWLLNKEQLVEALTEEVEFECQIEPTALNIKGGTKMNELENYVNTEVEAGTEVNTEVEAGTEVAPKKEKKVREKKEKVEKTQVLIGNIEGEDKVFITNLPIKGASEALKRANAKNVFVTPYAKFEKYVDGDTTVFPEKYTKTLERISAIIDYKNLVKIEDVYPAPAAEETTEAAAE